MIQNTYKNGSSVHKSYCREFVCGLVKKSRCRRVLTLPFTNFILEKQLVDLGVEVHCVERSSSTFEVGKKNKPTQVIYKHMDIFDYVRTAKQPFDYIWFDLCSNLSNNVLSQFLSIIGHPNVQGYASFTYTMNREYTGKEIAKFYDCTLKELRNEIFIQKLTEFAHLAGKKLKLVHQYQYQSDSNTPMQFLTFKIN